MVHDAVNCDVKLRVGLRTDPCETPFSRSFVGDLIWSSRTWNFRSERKFLMKFARRPLMFHLFKAERILGFHVVSNALLKSKKMAKR